MRSRPDPKPLTKRRSTSAFNFDQRIEAFLDGPSGGINPLAELGEEKLLYATESVGRRDLEQVYGKQIAREHWKLVEPRVIDELKATAPPFAHPEWTDKVEDIGRIFSQPEMQLLWALIDPSGRKRDARSGGKRGPDGAWTALKALGATLALGRKASHFDDAYADLQESKLARLFSDVNATSVAYAHRHGHHVPDYGPVVLPRCDSLTRQKERLGIGFRERALEARIAMLKRLDRLIGGGQIGRRLGIDATPVAAWVDQVSGKDNPAREAQLRRQCPDAGFRAYRYTSTGKEDRSSKVTKRQNTGISRAWRGYLLTTIVDLATGLPLNSALIDASRSEWEPLATLLNEIYGLWPELCDRTEMMAGDSAYDHELPCHLLEAHYGIAPVFRLHLNAGPQRLRYGRSDSLKHYIHDGRLVCIHDKVLDYLTADRKRDAGLAPGEPMPDSAFRVRAAGCHKCGSVGAPMRNDWSKLTAIPHHPFGRPDLFAKRIVALARHRNMTEGHFNRLKTGHHLGGEDAYRTRLRDRATHEALFHWAELGMIALALDDQAERKGQAAPRVSPLVPGGPAPTAVVYTMVPSASASAPSDAVVSSGSELEEEAEEAAREPEGEEVAEPEPVVSSAERWDSVFAGSRFARGGAPSDPDPEQTDS